MVFSYSPRLAGGTGQPRARRTILTVEALEERNLLSGPSHLLYDPVNGQPFAWPNQLSTDPTHINIFYDFRARNGFPNHITPTQKSLVAQALDLWTTASHGVLRFTQSTIAPLTQTINIGTGDLG